MENLTEKELSEINGGRTNVGSINLGLGCGGGDGIFFNPYNHGPLSVVNPSGHR